MQNNTVYFTNPGSFDIASMLTFGLSAKADDNAIGFFGTGFKYAVSIILRNLGSIKITTKNESGGRETYSFISRKRVVRGKDFDVVYLVDHQDGSEREAGFTTRLGINWESWMAFRELYCNAIDEGGQVSTAYHEDDTVIEVRCDEISKVMAKRDQYILSGEPDYVHPSAEIINRPSKWVYYKGIAIGMVDTALTYNIVDRICLTEDRTIKHEWQVRWAIQKAAQSLVCPSMIRKVASRGEHYEAEVGFDTDAPTSDQFQAECRAMMKTQAGVNEGARALILALDEKLGNWPEFALNEINKKSYQKAVSFLAKIDVPVEQYPIKFVEGLGQGVMGRALDGVIYISPIAFDMGVKQLASTLMEEWVHIKTGAKDFDRTMQNWLFDKILSIGESVVGEPI